MVSAIPENLIKYSAACTWAAQDLQNWVRGVLRPALLAYQNAGHPCVELDAEVAAMISKAYYTDRDAHVVALAFQQTQHATLGGHGVVSAKESDVMAAYNLLQQQNQARMKAGAALAAKLMALQPPSDGNRLGSSPEAAKPILQELAKHADDPYFCAGFYNALDAPHLDTALAVGGIPALVSAYSSGAVSAQTTRLVAMRLAAPAGHGGPGAPGFPWSHISSGQKAQLLDALAANPSASYFLAKSLTSHEIRDIFYGDRQYSAKVMTILAVGIRGEHSPQDARELMHKVSLGLFGDGAPTLTNSEWKHLAGAVNNFYAYGVLHGVEPPTDFTKRGLEEWQRITGANTGEDVALFLKALNAANPDNELLKSMIQGGYVNVAFMAIPGEGAAATAALGALQSAYSSLDPGMKLLDKVFPAGDHPNSYAVNRKLAEGAFTQSLGLLGAQGQVYDPWGNVVHFTGEAAHDQKYITRMLDHPDDYTVGKGKGKVTVNELLDAFGRTEKDEPLDALGNGNYKPSYG
ncbi:hypothetical protein AB0L14_23475 [Streptomyces sp. NPDC052727]|uniref:hypothetical protein n=1 Tax=Streptomyces sp. NPDC052727 TaxID=3154854 RepID=UPI00342E28BC